MKIIHCSDLHLDSALRSNLSPEKAAERGAELCTSFGRMVRYAVREGVDAVLIAGDLFDSAHVSARTSDFVLEQICSAPHVTFFCIRGNHDEYHPAFADRKLPGNLVTFGPQWASHRCGDVVITAMQPEGSGWLSLYGDLKLNPQDLNIVMLHGQISTQPGTEQIALPLLRDKHIHYLALGHLHGYQPERHILLQRLSGGPWLRRVRTEGIRAAGNRWRQDQKPLCSFCSAAAA